MKRQIGWCLAFILGTLVASLTVGAFMESAPGLLPCFLLLLLWPAREMTWESEFDLAMRSLTKGSK